MKHSDLISVIIPIYNLEKYLSVCLESIINQTYSNLEILCVDDGSTDKSAIVCEEYAEKDDRVKLFKIENGGVGNARNYALNHMSGDWFAFVDGDDWLEPNYFEILLKNAIENKCDISACQFQRNSSFIMGNDVINNVVVLSGTNECIHNFICGGVSLMGQSCNKIYLAEKYGSVRFSTSIKVNEDCLYTYEIMLKCDAACVTEAQLYHWFFRGDSACHSKKVDVDFTAANVFITLMSLTENMKDEDIEVTLKRNYIDSVCKVLIYAKCKNSDEQVHNAKDLCKKWRKDVWKTYNLKRKIKYILALYFS